MNLGKILDKIITFSYLLLFALVPLAFTEKTSELFEFNKMWLTFGIALVILGTWGCKTILQKQFKIQRTPLDIPIILFLCSQIISTVLSIDQHVSLWGYYSRFNGGLLSTITYIFLYYAFLSNFTGSDNKTLTRFLFAGLLGGAFVALWGLPSHFGYDPTCLLFRGTFDVSCWTDAFQPKIRMFSTLGQPNWLAAYLGILIPITISFAIQKTQNTQLASKISVSDFLKHWTSETPANRVFRVFWKQIIFFLISILFFIDILWTGSQSGFVGMGVSILVFAGLIVYPHWKEKLKLKLMIRNSKFLLLIFAIFALLTFIIGSPISQLNSLTLPALTASKTKAVEQKPQQIVGELGGTDSSKIRRIVWLGAVDVWRANMLFGSGVETFAYSYYNHRPASHNLTSEWDYLYNKAHNEYLNMLATTGTFGLGTYLLMIGWFLYVTLKSVLTIDSRKSKVDSPSILVIGLISGYISILVTNFFGFSVVITQIYLFMIPAFLFVLLGLIDTGKVLAFPRNESRSMNYESWKTWIPIGFILLTSCYLLLMLIRYWQADVLYSEGYNLNRAGVYDSAYSPLMESIQIRGDEPTFRDEFSYTNAVLAAAFASQQDATSSSELAQQAIILSDDLVTTYPKNVVFWKTRVRVFNALSQADTKFLIQAIDAVEQASKLAPTDAKVSYTRGVLYGQGGDYKKAVEVLQESIQLKPDYRDAYFALGLFYKEAGEQQKATDSLNYILQNLSPEDVEVKKTLDSWGPQ